MLENQTSFEHAARRPLSNPVVLGAGPVGRAVAAALVATGLQPLVLTRSGTAVPSARAQAVDITSASALTDALRGADAVFQCAQPAYHRWPEEFPPLQRAVVDALRGSGAVLVAVENLYGYGPVEGPMTESTPMRPNTRKGRVRAAMWQELVAVHGSGDLAVAAVRASDFVGPGVEASAFGERFIRPLVRGKAAQVLGDPDALHSVTYVPDLAAAMVRVAEEPSAWGRAWHAPTAPAVTQRELAGLVASAAGSGTVDVRPVRPWMLRLGGVFIRPLREMIEMAYEFEHDFVVDSGAIEERFGLRPTPLADALTDSVAAMRR